MLKEIFAVSNFPYLQQGSNNYFGDKFATLLKSYGLVFLGLLFIAAPVTAITDSFVVHILHYKSIKNLSNISIKEMLHKTGYVFGLTYVCLIGPVLEETVFRLPLSFKRTPIIIGLSLATFLILVLIPGAKNPHSDLAAYLFITKLAVAIGTFFVLKKFLPVDINLSKKIKTVLIITSICLFGLMHISNYSPIQWPIIWIYPVFVLPQLIMGLLITFVRFKNGFIWGIALHCMINSIAMAFAVGHDQQIKAKPVHAITKQAKKDTDSVGRK